MLKCSKIRVMMPLTQVFIWSLFFAQCKCSMKNPAMLTFTFAMAQCRMKKQAFIIKTEFCFPRIKLEIRYNTCQNMKFRMDLTFVFEPT